MTRLALLVACACTLLTSMCAEEKKNKPTLLILSSHGGYGHTAAANTLQSILGSRYNLKVIHPIDELRIWGVAGGEQVYNMFLNNGWIRTTNIIAHHIAPRLFRSRQKKVEKIIQAHINEEKPTALISLIPFVNLPASEAARKSKLPCLVITTDNDLKNWVLGMELVKHPHLKITIGNDLPQTREMLLKKRIPNNAIETIGLPLRLDFIAEKNKEQLRNDYKLPPNKPVIMIMMGGTGAKCAYNHVRRILGMKNLPAHLIVCTGRDRKLAAKLRKLKVRAPHSMTVMGFTDKISDLMAISDVIITKPGPGSINEAISMKLPILIDSTSASLYWEKANIALVRNYGIGDCIKKSKQIGFLLRQFLYNSKQKEKVKEAYSRIPPNRFHQRIVELVDDMCVSPQTKLACQ